MDKKLTATRLLKEVQDIKKQASSEPKWFSELWDYAEYGKGGTLEGKQIAEYVSDQSQYVAKYYEKVLKQSGANLKRLSRDPLDDGNNTDIKKVWGGQSDEDGMGWGFFSNDGNPYIWVEIHLPNGKFVDYLKTGPDYKDGDYVKQIRKAKAWLLGAIAELDTEITRNSKRVARNYLKKASIEPGSLNKGVEVICDVLGAKHKGKVLSWDDRFRKVQVEFSSGQKMGVSYDDATLANPPAPPFHPDAMLKELRKEISKMKFPKSMPVTKIYLGGSHPHGATIHFTGYQSSKVTQRIGKLKIMKKLGFEYSSRHGVQGSLVLNDGSGYNYIIAFFSSGRSSVDTDLWYEDAYKPKRNQWGW